MWDRSGVTFGEAAKRCRKCGKQRALSLFPRDRSKPDGHWHTCKACNRTYWHERGSLLAALRKGRQAAQLGPTRTGLRDLRRYHHKDSQPFASVPPELRSQAQQLLNKYLYRHRRRLTPALIACLHACAASNVKRLGDRSWARSLRRKKGYYRSLRRKAQAEAQQDEIRARGPTLRVYYTDLTGI